MGTEKALRKLTQAYKEGKIAIGPGNETVVDMKFEDVTKT